MRLTDRRPAIRKVFGPGLEQPLSELTPTMILTLHILRFVLCVFSGAAAVAPSAAEPACSTLEEVQSRTHGPREKAFAVDCGSLRAEAIYWDRSIVLAAYGTDGKPIEPDERALSAFGSLIAHIVATQPDVGRWTLSVNRYEAFGPRLAAAAGADKAWDARGGRPREGRVNIYVLDLSNSARTFTEIERVAEVNALKARVSSVEKVLLCPSPARTGERLPCGASIWFALTRE